MVPQVFNVEGTITTVHLAALGERNRGARVFRKWRGRSQKRDDCKDCGEREVHLLRGMPVELITVELQWGNEGGASEPLKMDRGLIILL